MIFTMMHTWFKKLTNARSKVLLVLTEQFKKKMLLLVFPSQAI